MIILFALIDIMSMIVYNLTGKINSSQGVIPMHHVSTTKLSSRGQIVIPEELRKKLGLETGTQFVVITDNKDTLVLKVIIQPSMDEFTALIKKAQSVAQKVGLTKQDIKAAIKKVRKSD